MANLPQGLLPAPYVVCGDHHGLPCQLLQQHVQAGLQEELDADSERLCPIAQRVAQGRPQRHEEAGVAGGAFQAGRLPHEGSVAEFAYPECQIATPLFRFQGGAFGLQQGLLIQAKLAIERGAGVDLR